MTRCVQTIRCSNPAVVYVGLLQSFQIVIYTTSTGFLKASYPCYWLYSDSVHVQTPDFLGFLLQPVALAIDLSCPLSVDHSTGAKYLHFVNYFTPNVQHLQLYHRI